MMLKRLMAIAGLAALLFAPLSVVAHPHVWIDMTTKVLFDKKGHVRGLEVHWVFDPFYSAFLDLRVKELKKAGNKNAYASFAKNMAGRIKEQGYFTEATADNVRLSFETHSNTAAGKMRDGKDGDRFWVRFQLNLEKPIDPRKKQFVYAVYDPTYYIEILHREKKPAFTMVGIEKGRCWGHLIKPRPDAQAKTLAASLDKTESAGDTLGQLFAEKISLQCK